MAQSHTALRAIRGLLGKCQRGSHRERHLPPQPGPTAIELSPSAGPHWQALNLNPNRNLARLRFLEIKSKITIKIGKKPFRLNSRAVSPCPLPARRGEGG